MPRLCQFVFRFATRIGSILLEVDERLVLDVDLVQGSFFVLYLFLEIADVTLPKRHKLKKHLGNSFRPMLGETRKGSAK